MSHQEPNLDLLSPYLEAGRLSGPDDEAMFVPAVERLGANTGLLREAGDLLLKTFHVAGARLCYEKALAIEPDNSEICFRLASALLGLRRIDEAMSLVAHFAARHEIFSYSVVDQICNEALWLGRHRTVAEFLAGNVATFDHAVATDPDSYFAEAFLAYACESDLPLFHGLCNVYRARTGNPYPYIEQTCITTLPAESEFLFSSHCYAGTSALVNLLLLLGVRVDEMARRWGPEYALDEATALRSYVVPSVDDLPARVLHRHFALNRQVRCYAYAHRLPNPSHVAGRLAIFLMRDPRTSITTWGKPTRSHVDFGSFGRFAITRAHDWCRFVDGFESIDHRMVIRFEDWQKNPRAVAEALIDRLGISVREGQLQEALHYSGTDLSRQFRAFNMQLRNLSPARTANADDPPAQREMLNREYELITDICGSRLERYGYDVV